MSRKSFVGLEARISLIGVEARNETGSSKLDARKYRFLP
jgi:hypothetical protein